MDGSIGAIQTGVSHDIQKHWKKIYVLALAESRQDAGDISQHGDFICNNLASYTATPILLSYICISETKTDDKGKLRFIQKFQEKNLNHWTEIGNAYINRVSKENIVSLLSASSSLLTFFDEMEQSVPYCFFHLILLMQSVKTPLLQQHRCNCE